LLCPPQQASFFRAYSLDKKYFENLVFSLDFWWLGGHWAKIVKTHVLQCF